MRSTWYATYVCNVKSISMTVEKWSVQSVHFRVIKRETRWSRGQGRAGQTCSTMLNWARGSLRSALLHHKCAFYNPYQFLPFPQFLQGFTHVLSRKCRKWHLRALVGSFSLKSRMVGRLDNSGAGNPSNPSHPPLNLTVLNGSMWGKPDETRHCQMTSAWC